LGHVDRVIEADQGVERENGAGQDGRQQAHALLELEGPRRLARSRPERHDPDQDDQQQTRDLDPRKRQIEPDRLGDAVEVDEPDDHH